MRQGATVDVLGSRVPRLACLQPMAWLHRRPGTAHLQHQQLKTLARGQAPQGGRRKTSSGAASPGCLTRSGDFYASLTLRGSDDVSHDDQGQAGASGRRTAVSSSVLRRQAQARSTQASGKGFHINATRPRPAGRQDEGHHGAQGGVTTRAFCKRRLLLSG